MRVSDPQSVVSRRIASLVPEFEVAVLEIMHRHVPDLAEGALKMRPSSKGNYTAITITIQAQSREQLDAIYVDLTASELVAYAI